MKGLVCAFCAQGVKAKFGKVDAVKRVKVNMDTMEVKVLLKPGRTVTVDQVKKTVEEAGYTYVGLVN